MSTPENVRPKYMLDTNVFNWLVQGDLSIDDLPSDGDFVATPVQREELRATKEYETREALLAKFSQIVSDLYSAPFAFGIPGAGFGEGRWTDGKLAKAIQTDLDGKQKKPKPNNLQDALIAEAAIAANCTLVTCDQALRDAAEAHGCKVWFFEKTT